MRIPGRKNSIKVDEGFDSGDRLAGELRSVQAGEMSPEAGQRLVGHLLSIQRRMLAEKRAPRHTVRNVLVPAMAVVLVLAIAAAIVIPMLGDGRKPPGPGTAKLDTPLGDVSVKDPGGEWTGVKQGESASPGELIRTGPGSGVSVLFSNGSIMRITGSSEARIIKLQGRGVSVEHLHGSTYHRVKEGTRYAVTTGKIRSRAAGTAFNIDSRDPDCLEVLSVDDTVHVEIGEHSPIEVAEGEVMTVSLSGRKKAAKQLVSRERLIEAGLLDFVRKDAGLGFDTGIYQAVEGGLDCAEEPAAIAGDPVPELKLVGTVCTDRVALDWKVPGNVAWRQVNLLRSESGEPTYPGDVITSYENTGINCADDNTVSKGRAYQYRLCAILPDGKPVYSNTVLVSIQAGPQAPAMARVSLVAQRAANGARLEWSVAGASDFDGFLVERKVTAAPTGSKTPAGTTGTTRLYSHDVLMTWLDTNVQQGCTYSYRVGLVVGDCVMTYSDSRTVEITGR